MVTFIWNVVRLVQLVAVEPGNIFRIHNLQSFILYENLLKIHWHFQNKFRFPIMEKIAHCISYFQLWYEVPESYILLYNGTLVQILYFAPSESKFQSNNTNSTRKLFLCMEALILTNYMYFLLLPVWMFPKHVIKIPYCENSVT